MFISLLESVKAKCVFCSRKIQYYLSFLTNSCFDQFRFSLCSRVFIKVTLWSSFTKDPFILDNFGLYFNLQAVFLSKYNPSGKKVISCSLKAQWSVFGILKTVSKFSEWNTTDNFQFQKCPGTSILKFQPCFKNFKKPRFDKLSDTHSLL